MPAKTYLINQDEEVRFLSNFSRHKVVVDNVTYETSEHYYQAAKFFDTDPEWAKLVGEANGPVKCKKMGNSREHKIHNDWNKGAALFYMEKVLVAKVKQHQCVMDQLMATGDDYIVERADWDPIWGDGPDRYGKNQLGRLWMKVRRDIRAGTTKRTPKTCPLCFGKENDCKLCSGLGTVEIT